MSSKADVAELSTFSLRCVECEALYPAVETGCPPRYRCDCGGVLDVETVVRLPVQTGLPAGAAWHQLFDERASHPPTWPISTDELGTGEIMKFNDQSRHCHAERSEASVGPSREALRFAQGDNPLPISIVKSHHHPHTDHSGVWRYRELILPIADQYIISRPEGNTGLYPVGSENCGHGRAGHRQIGLFAGLERCFLKHEGENPTGSFKDRGMTVGVTMANLLRAHTVACASTGNTSASLASYAAQAGMRSIVFLPAGNVAAGKLAQSLAYGATTIQINGDFDDAMRLVEQVCNELGIYLLNSLNPFRIEGQKAIGFELLQQLDWQAPDWLVLPAGNLGNTSAIGKAFRQAHQLGLIGHMPRVAAIQAAGANPFYRSFMHGFTKQERVQAHTIASAIKIGNPVSYTRARRIIEESDGIVEEVSDEEILAAKNVIDRSGIGCEPASAATLAGMRKLVARGIIKRDTCVVGILTGHLLKDGQTGSVQHNNGVVVEANIDAVRRVLEDESQATK